jgi:prepilin-type N-terminal cleavage/methylation domain-containing protein
LKLKLNTLSVRGFTLVEIMIVVAIIALLAAGAVPYVLRARQRAQATVMLDDLRALDGALDQYAIEDSLPDGFEPNGLALMPYIKQGSRLYNSCDSTGTCHDLFGRPYDLEGGVGGRYAINQDTYAALSDVAPADFWSPYAVDGQ